MFLGHTKVLTWVNTNSKYSTNINYNAVGGECSSDNKGWKSSKFNIFVEGPKLMQIESNIFEKYDRKHISYVKCPQSTRDDAERKDIRVVYFFISQILQFLSDTHYTGLISTWKYTLCKKQT